MKQRAQGSPSYNRSELWGLLGVEQALWVRAPVPQNLQTEILSPPLSIRVGETQSHATN